MSRRVFLHVATAKSGSSYIQSALWQNKSGLEDQGLLLPATFDTHYVAAKAVTERPNMRTTTVDVRTAWPRLVQEAKAWAGDVLISHELFAPATAEQAQLALADLADAELHLILTARSLHKQLPAAWQQGVRGGLQLTLERFVNKVHNERGRGAWFWKLQDVPRIAERWGADVPPEHIHVVTVPADPAEPTTIFRRFVSATGHSLSDLDLNLPRRNVSLGRAEVEMLRRLHTLQDERFTDPRYSPWTRDLLVDHMLARRQATPIVVPPEWRQWVSQRGAAMSAEIHQRGYDVVGDLADLTAYSPAREQDPEDEPDVDEVVKWTISELQQVLVDLGAPRADASPRKPAQITDVLDLLDEIRKVKLRERFDN